MHKSRFLLTTTLLALLLAFFASACTGDNALDSPTSTYNYTQHANHSSCPQEDEVRMNDECTTIDDLPEGSQIRQVATSMTIYCSFPPGALVWVEGDGEITSACAY